MESYITLMLFIPALPNTKKTTLRNMVVHQMAALSKSHLVCQMRRGARPLVRVAVRERRLRRSRSLEIVREIQVC